jgi:acetyl esterase/lipase
MSSPATAARARGPRVFLDYDQQELDDAYDETPEFQRQSREFAAALRAAGKPVELIYAEGYNHFEIAETLANPYGHVGRAVLEQAGLGEARA